MKRRQPAAPLELHELPKAYRELGADAFAAGFTVVRTRGDHLQWRGPHGDIVHTASSPSDWRAIKNDRARLERLGLPKRGRSKRRRKRVC